MAATVTTRTRAKLAGTGLALLAGAGTTLLTGAGLVLLAPAPAGAVASPQLAPARMAPPLKVAPVQAVPTPSPGATPVTRAGTSFLTAAGIAAEQPVRVDAALGDYLYWSFPTVAGERHEITATVSFARPRSGGSTWTVEVFDGLRRRQPCTAGAQTPTVDAAADRVSLGCTLRQVRSWAEPWSADPLPGTYYVRLSVVELPEPDLGLPIEVELLAGADGAGSRDDGELKAPLVPNAKAGAVLDAEPAARPTDEDEGEEDYLDWLPDLGSRWIWSAIGGVLAAVAGVVGFSLTRRPRRP